MDQAQDVVLVVNDPIQPVEEMPGAERSAAAR